MNGSQQICFTDSAGKALFSIPDNGLLCLFYGNGDRHFAVCHRLDDTLSLIHISEPTRRS